MQDPFDVNLTDGDLLREVELMTILMVAATDSDGPLPQRVIDRLLGIAALP